MASLCMGFQGQSSFFQYQFEPLHLQHPKRKIIRTRGRRGFPKDFHADGGAPGSNSRHDPPVHGDPKTSAFLWPKGGGVRSSNQLGASEQLPPPQPQKFLFVFLFFFFFVFVFVPHLNGLVFRQRLDPPPKGSVGNVLPKTPKTPAPGGGLLLTVPESPSPGPPHPPLPPPMVARSVVQVTPRALPPGSPVGCGGSVDPTPRRALPVGLSRPSQPKKILNPKP